MAHEFNVELTSQQEWSWLVAIDLFLAGLGGGLFLLFQLFNLPPSVGLLSLTLVFLGGLVLLAELGHPLRAWRAICKPRTSWISRGVIFVLLFMICGFLSIASAFDTLSWLPWASDGYAARILWMIAGVLAFLVTIYPGFVLSVSPSIPFWNSPLLPILFFSYSVLGASGMVLVISPWVFVDSQAHGLNFFASLVIVANLIMLVTYLLTLKGSNLAAKQAVKVLNEGALGWLFKLGVILLGMVIPLLVVLWIPSAVALAGGFILMGGLLFRYCVLKAGVYVPFPLT
jgi:formate-dependent nitrite reductase membrane component NrfD